jgi:hypothetical protein
MTLKNDLANFGLIFTRTIVMQKMYLLAIQVFFVTNIQSDDRTTALFARERRKNTSSTISFCCSFGHCICNQIGVLF